MSRQTKLQPAAALFGALLLAAPAAAQQAEAPQTPAAQPPDAIEEITVTAQKREQSAQDVGISLSAISYNELHQNSFGNAQEVTSLAAGVSTVQPNGEANYTIAIRGAVNSDFTTNQESPVAVYLDDVYISQASGSGFMLFDMERVEFLRGPQGTLFGRNATGGLAHFVTRKPAQESDGYAKITLGEFSQFKLEGAVGGALQPGLTSARLSFSGHWNDGYIENRSDLQNNLNNANDKAVRLQFLATPGEDLSFLLNLRLADQEIRTGFFEHATSVTDGGVNVLRPNLENAVLGYVDGDGDVFAGEYDGHGHNDLETHGITATVNWDFDDVTFTSITDFSSVKRDYIEDSDASPVPLFRFYLTTDADQFSQELRLAGQRDKLNWVAGFYYLDIDVNDSNGAETEPFSNTPAADGGFGDDPNRNPDIVTGLDNPYSLATKSWSVFGQAEYELNEQFTLVGGFRWINDERDFRFEANFVDFIPGTRLRGGNPNIVSALVPGGAYEGARDDGAWSARAGLNYHLNEDALLYASWNRGVRSGGFNAPIFPYAASDLVDAGGNGYLDANLRFEPEELDAFEIGFKSTLASGRLQLNGSAYYNDYQDYQVFEIVVVDTITRNAEADSSGFELEAVAIPAEGLTLRAGAAYNDIEATLRNGTTVTPVQSPEWNVNALARYEWQMLGGTMALQADADYRSEHFFNLSGFETVTEDGYAVANASLRWTNAEGSRHISVFVRNLTDEEYLVQTFDLTAFFGMTEQYYGRPQWVGASVGVHF